MRLSVVVPTLDARERLAATLDALADHAPDAEVIVVNGPSTDGTTGMVRDCDDVDVLVEVADRTVNAARNAGIERASGDVVAFVDQGLAVAAEWRAALEEGLDGAGAVTGPVHEQLRGGRTTESVESRTIRGREVTYFNGGNVAFSREAIDALDGFDEYLHLGGARDSAHRLAGMDYRVVWQPRMGVERPVGADGGTRERDWGWKYRSLAYRLVKNYGLRPTVLGRIAVHACRDAGTTLRDVAGGEATPSTWLGTGRTIIANTAGGIARGRWARTLDRTPRRNPHGVSSKTDRAIAVYDRR